MSRNSRTVGALFAGLLVLPVSFALASEEGAKAGAEDEAVQAAELTIDLCVLWADAETLEPFENEEAIERCIEKPTRSECHWSLVEDLTLAQAASYEAQGYVVIDPDADPQLMSHLDGRIWRVKKLADECAIEFPGLAGGLGTAAKVGLGVGAVAAAVLNLDENKGEASPSSP